MPSQNQSKFNVRITPDAGVSLDLDTTSKSLYYVDQNGNVVMLASFASNGGNFTNVNITGGTIQGVALTLDSLDSTPIGFNTPSTGRFTTLTSTGLASFNSMSTVNATITGGSISGVSLTLDSLDNTPIGVSTPNSGAFTTLSTNTVTSVTPVLGFNASNTSYASGSTIANNYLQTILQNKSGSTGASTNYVLSNDLGTDSSYYGEFGMNSSVFSSGTPNDFFSINNGVYFSGHDGDLTFGSGNGYKSYFAWGATGASAHVINTSGAIGLSTNLGTTPALSGTTGFGTAGQVMISNGSGAANTWSSTPTLVGTNFTGIPNGALTNNSITFGATAAALGSTVSALNAVSIGATTASTGAFTSLTYSSTLTGGTGIVNLGSGQFYKDASGNIGIGVTPSAWYVTYKAIELQGGSFSGGSADINFSQNAYLNGSVVQTYKTSNFATRYTQYNGQHQWFNAPSGTAGNPITFTQAMTLDASGNLLVGITSASGFAAKTIVNRQNVTGAPIFTWTNNANNSGHTYVFANGSGISSDGYLAFGSNEAGAGAFTERMRIDTSGNLNIGSTANIGASENTNAGVTNYGQGIVAIARSSTSAALDVSKIGTLGSGTMQQFSYNGGVIGSITNTSSAVAYVTSSDYRLKENIAPMTGALDTVAKLKPVTYTWKADGSDGQGFIAHELAEVVPDCVSGEKDAVNEDGSIKPQGIDTSFLVATLTAAIQELKAIVDTQAEQIKALQGAK